MRMRPKAKLTQNRNRNLVIGLYGCYFKVLPGYYHLENLVIESHLDQEKNFTI